jgi:hypothetical protein
MAVTSVDTTSRSQPRVSGRRAAAATAVVAIALAAVFVSVRVGAVDFEGFVAAGDVNAEGTSIFTYDHHGYDGQFFYRLALQPLSTAERVDGIAFDASAYRQQRIGYPLLAFLTAATTPLSTVQALVIVNLIAIGVMVYFGARIAQHLGRSPTFALLLLAWPAFIFSLGLDLSEIVAAALVLGAFSFAMRHQHTAATFLLCGAALTRETTALVAVAAIVVYRRWIYAWVVGVLASWQVAVWVLWGEIPGLTSLPAPGERLLGPPFAGLIQGAQRWGIIDVAVGFSLLVVMWIGANHFRKGTLAGTAFLGYGLLALCLGWPVWESWRGFSRATVELVLMVFVLRLGPGSTVAEIRTEVRAATAPESATET